MLGYSRERIGYRLFDIENKVVVEERNVIFNETQKGSYYMRKGMKGNSYESWNIEDFINISSNDDNDNEENEINQDIQEINRDTDEIESDEEDDIQDRVEPVNNQDENRVHAENRSKGRPRGLTMAESVRRKEEYLKEREDRLRKEGVRRSVRLNKQYVQVAENIPLPCSFVEARNGENWEDWKGAMEDELESLNRHNVWYMYDRPKNEKIVKSK